MGNTLSMCSCRKHKVGSIKEITLLLIGLDNAGKTCAVKHLQGEPTSDAVPTVGFTSIKLKHERHAVCIYDVGGGPHIRDIWKNYYALVHGIIFVIDSSMPERFDECRNVIRRVLHDKRVAGKPVLLYFNKQDLENSVDETELVCKLELEALVNEMHCPTRVESTCAIYDEKKGKNPGIWEGFSWLIGHISKEFKSLHERVCDEKSEQMRLEEQERLQRIARVQKIREERLRLQQEEEKAKSQKSNGCSFATVQEEDEDDKDVIIQNPFKPVSLIKTELEQNEQHIMRSHLPENLKEDVKENNELILQPHAASSSLEFHRVPVQYTPGVHLPPDVQGELSKRIKAQKLKKRFKNRVVPQVSENLSMKITDIDLPPLKATDDVLNGKLHKSDSIEWKQQRLANGHVNQPCEELFSLSSRTKSHEKEVKL